MKYVVIDKKVLKEVSVLSGSLLNVVLKGGFPAGLFACSALLRRSPTCFVDVFDSSPVPFGLVRYGVAPDHQEVKNCTHGFEKMFNTFCPGRLSLYCNVKIGKDVSIAELRERYSTVLLAYGAHKPRRLNILGSDAVNVITGSDFVSWYSGAPGAPRPALDSPSALIIGNGNVALDCARVLCLGSRLSDKDVPEAALQLLANSSVRFIRIIGRRGAADVSFTIKELREQFRLNKEWRSVVEMDEEEREELTAKMSSMQRPKRRISQLLLDNVGNASEEEESKWVRFSFYSLPEQIVKDQFGRVSTVIVSRRSGRKEVIPAGLVIASLGYESVVLPGLPVGDKGRLRLMKSSSRVEMDNQSDGLASVFATGWCATGAKGVIADSQQNAAAVVQEMSWTLLEETHHHEGAGGLLEERAVKFISWADWLRIDQRERQGGEERGKIREKITDLNQIFEER